MIFFVLILNTENADFSVMLGDVKMQQLRARVAEGSSNIPRAIEALMKARELQIMYVQII
jgi:hypothetical protein